MGLQVNLILSYWSELLPEDSDGLLHLGLEGLGYLQHVQQFRVIHLQQHAWGGRRGKKGVGGCDERSGLVVPTRLPEHCSLTQKLWVFVPSSWPYAIPNVTKCETDSGQKSGYYVAILSGKEDHGLWSLSTAKHFASSLRQRGMQVNLSALMSVRSYWDLVHSGCKCKITSCTGEKGARKLHCTYAP